MVNTAHVLCLEQLTPSLVDLALAQELENLSSGPSWFHVNKEVTIRPREGEAGVCDGGQRWENGRHLQ